jgi:exodeoxyribonuclease VII large subunit
MALEPAASPWSVGALVRALADTLAARYGAVRVEGEISGFTRAASGHCYFALRDDTAQLRCVMFRQRAALVDFDLRDGLRVELRAALGVYEPRGDLQLNVESVRRAGQGALLEQFLRLKAKLRAEGLFETARKRALPEHPRAVGIVTSPQAAALHDVLATLARRSPQLRVIVYPASVQGAAAPAELLRALRQADARAEVDLLLLVRGGGALEDLWAFNDEALARCIAALRLPVISGVGHETDFTIADFVADLRAATPTAAAELCAPAWADLLQALDARQLRLRHAVQRLGAREQQRLDRLQLRLPTPTRLLGACALRLRELQARLQRRLQGELARQGQALAQRQSRLAALPVQDLARRRARLDETARRLRQALAQERRREHGRLEALARRLALLNPAATLERGYCLAWRADGSLLQEAAQLRAGDAVVLASARSAAALQLQGVAPVAHPLAAMLPDGSADSS